MAAADVTYLFFRRDQDGDVDGSSPTIKTTRVITHGGARNRAGSVPPAPLRGGSVPPRSTRAGSVAPSNHAGGIASSSLSASASGHHRRGGAQTFHRITSGGTLTESTVPASTAGHGLLNGGVGSAAGKVGTRAGIELDRRRRASLAAASLSPSELQQRSRTARESLIYRADDFLTGAKLGPGFIPGHLSALPPRTANGPLTVSVTSNNVSPSLRSPTSTLSSVRGRRASVSGPLTSDYRRSITTTTKSTIGDDGKQLNNVGGTGNKTNGVIIGGTFETPNKESLSGLRNRMNVAREQMSRHKLLLDRYLPFNNGPTNDVQYDVEYKVSELAARMPELDPNKRPLRTHHADNDSKPILLVTPYKPLPRVQKVELSTLPPVTSSFTPKISDVRKRARSVLCKVKGDPRYFDF